MSYGKADPPLSSAKPHLAIRNPSEWIIRFAPLVREGGPVLDPVSYTHLTLPTKA